MSAVRAFIFELDVAVAGTSQLQRDAFVNTFNAAVAKDALTGELHQLYLEGRTVAGKLAVCRDLFPALKWSDADVASAFSSAVVGAIATSKLSFTALGGLKWAKENGITVAAYSRSSRVVADALITALADATLFSAVVCADEVAAGKSGYEAVAAIVGTSHAVFDIEGADLAAAKAAGAVTVPVYDNLDITPAYLQSVAENGKAPAAAARLRIVVPMAGLGSRFAKDGFYIQKPFLPMVGGLQMWEQVIENLMPKEPELRAHTEVHLVVRSEQLNLFRRLPHVHLHTVPGLTEGAACTVLTLKDVINDDVPLVIGNSDQFMEWNSDEFYRASFHPSYDGGISVFYHPCPEDLKWSYASLNDDKLVTAVAEKKYLGPHATTGIYAWKKGSDYVKWAEDMIEKNIRVNNEFYVCPVYNGALEAGAAIRVHDCQKFWGIGVPDDFVHFLDHYRPRVTYTFEAALQRKYEAMWCKWSPRLPVPQPDVLADPQLCACMWTSGGFQMNDKYSQLVAALKPWADKLVFYDHENPSAPAVLHNTLFQFQTFPLNEEQRAGLVEPIKVWAEVAKTELAKLPAYKLQFTGVSPTRSGIVILGYPPVDFNPVRDAIRASGPVKEPHQQDVYHVTIARWVKQPTADEMVAVTAALEAFRTTDVGTMVPNGWHAGFATWSMRADTLQPVVSW